VLDAPVAENVESLRWRQPDHSALETLFDRLRFGPLTRSRCKALLPAQ